MNPRRKQRLTWVLILVFGVSVATGLMLYALSQSIDLFYTPSELVEGKGEDKQKPQVGQRMRVGGMVVEGSVKRDPKTLEVSFNITDTGPEITVLYQGILPDLFREGQGIVAQGELVEPTVLKATEVLAKHDEEYMPPELAEKMKGIKHVNPNKSYEDGDQ
ncbi:cytochrome c biogenesis protein CcmE [Idiomarina sp. WRN-38]|mgnify:FL=1|jgi:cytochrome c-type biogenesis protein CcmE|uniref:cytochrome c maturation protein CcmE n=1 Tax=unclassified Idiomarina TaxID=2614829 RepID=UPI00073354B1|nr:MULTISPECIES: cytochrome c maturation protein CcmE [unclassified Idiomarina]KTG24161.1 cytochrome C biogenesis protein CcmE [Idiomarina sp. H105]MBF38049.1 cytochrome c maturation protein CcmE [Idiomarinaceae bacterium]OAE91552.1 cytochrome c biogenesis protein CcmE [Idiomarina sp. WRN-38]MCJ8315871.1 cytochrome c maturation protein CcmE [Idiomarina sp.]NQZ15785.1 cytochrome c maturation protein CcmE [Idiomarina sp.]|tara:strand:+ start:10421 stop:10903 length:483 start_codon:yes stop_codon:yes gene_type:complete